MRETILNTLKATVAVALAFLFAGSVVAGEKHKTPLSDEIPDNANRIIMEQDEGSPADMYVDAMQFLQKRGYDITRAEDALELNSLNDLVENRPLTMNAEKQLNDDLALQITINVNTIPGGSELVASAYYADKTGVSEANWNQAKWTDGEAKKAFRKAFHALREGTYDTITFESGVAVAMK